MKLLYAACCVVTSLFICSSVAHAVPLLALGPANRLILIETSAPVATQIVAETQITGLQPGESLLAIDFRTSNGKLYGITDQSRLYTINTVTGAALQVGTGSFTPALNLGSGIEVGFDFNPVTDLIRVVTDSAGQNLRLNPDTGAVVGVDTTLAFATGDPNAARTPRGSALAYSNNVPGATSTTLFNIVNGNMSASEQTILTTLGSPGGAPSSPNSGQLFTVGNTGVFNGPTGFDIAPNGIAYALFNGTDTWNQFFTVNLSTGAGTVLTTGQQMFQLRDLAAPLPNSVLPQPPSLVISQVYGNGGTAGAPFNASFVELFNRGVQNLALNQWSLRITSDTSNT